LPKGPGGPLAPPVPVGNRGRPLYWASGASGPCAGAPWAASVFPSLTPALGFAGLGAVCGADAKDSEHGSPSVRWVPGWGTHGSFCLASGAFCASGACGSHGGDHGRLPCFHGLSPILGFAFSVDLGRRPCHLFTWSEGLAGGCCLSPPCWAAGSIRIQLLCHNFIRSRDPHR
jgi:hypothetical protein